MATISALLKGLSAYGGRSVLPDGFQAFWDERAAAAAAPREVTVGETPFETPVATYQTLRFAALDGRELTARYVAPKAGDMLPCVVMFHDVTCPPRGWHHLTRFVAPGHAVVELENRAWSGDVTEGWQEGPAALAFTRLIEDALVCACVARDLPRTDPAHLVAWGEGLGGGLALDVASLVPGFVKCAALNPLPADFRCVFEESGCGLLYRGLTDHFRACDPTGAHAEELFGVLDYVDTANFARGLGAELLLGTALMDTAATPASQFAIVNQVPGPKRHLTYPKWGHDRVNAFEDQLLQFLH